jgi:hypothetical protein
MMIIVHSSNPFKLYLAVVLLFSSMLHSVVGQDLTPEQQANTDKTLNIGYVSQPIHQEASARTYPSVS